MNVTCKQQRKTMARLLPSATFLMAPSLLMALVALGVTARLAAAQSDTPFEERSYSFSIDQGTCAQVIGAFARQAGLDVLGSAPRCGKVTYTTKKALGFEEALERMRALLFGCKPHEPYWIAVSTDHLELAPVSDFYRRLPVNRVFAGLEAYKAARLGPSELALVVFVPEGRTAEAVAPIRDLMPDYFRVSAMGNGVAVFGLVHDIDRYLQLVQKLDAFLMTPVPDDAQSKKN